jgi:hypothetical protein
MYPKFAGDRKNMTPEDKINKWNFRYQEAYTEAYYQQDARAMFRIGRQADRDYDYFLLTKASPAPPALSGPREDSP